MREQLIKLAKEKGFEMFIDNFENQIDNSIIYYLILCELQKWLEDNKKLFVIITPNIAKDIFIDSAKAELIYSSDVWELEGEKWHLMSENAIPKERLLALETGCYEALKLIE